MDFRVLFVLTTLLLAGCLQGKDADVAPTTTASSPPKPIQAVRAQTINACPGGPDSPYQTTAKTGDFEVKPGYDEIIIAFHDSGHGQGGGSIVWKEETSTIWSRPTNTQINSQTTPCGGHAHSSAGETKKVEPGNYTWRLSYAGPVSIHFEVTAKSSKAAETSPTHTHVAR